MTTRPDYEETIRQIRRQREKIVNTKPGWRDYITRQRVGTAVCLAGLAVSVFSGRDFANKFADVLEKFGQERLSIIQYAAGFQDYETIKTNTNRITADLETSAYWTIGGITAAGLGYATARWKPREQWSPKISKHEKVTTK